MKLWKLFVGVRDVEPINRQTTGRLFSNREETWTNRTFYLAILPRKILKFLTRIKLDCINYSFFSHYYSVLLHHLYAISNTILMWGFILNRIFYFMGCGLNIRTWSYLTKISTSLNEENESLYTSPWLPCVSLEVSFDALTSGGFAFSSYLIIKVMANKIFFMRTAIILTALMVATYSQPQPERMISTLSAKKFQENTTGIQELRNKLVHYLQVLEPPEKNNGVSTLLGYLSMLLHF